MFSIRDIYRRLMSPEIVRVEQAGKALMAGFTEGLKNPVTMPAPDTADSADADYIADSDW